MEEIIQTTGIIMMMFAILGNYFASKEKYYNYAWYVWSFTNVILFFVSIMQINLWSIFFFGSNGIISIIKMISISHNKINGEKNDKPNNK